MNVIIKTKRYGIICFFKLVKINDEFWWEYQGKLGSGNIAIEMNTSDHHGYNSSFNRAHSFVDEHYLEFKGIR